MQDEGAHEALADAGWRFELHPLERPAIVLGRRTSAQGPPHLPDQLPRRPVFRMAQSWHQLVFFLVQGRAEGIGSEAVGSSRVRAV